MQIKKDLKIKTISNRNNKKILSLSDDKITIDANTKINATANISVLKINSISNSSSTDSIVWNNPIINVNGKNHRIIYKRDELPMRLGNLKFWFDLGQKDCWNRTSPYIRDLVNGDILYGIKNEAGSSAPEGMTGYGNMTSRHFVNEIEGFASTRGERGSYSAKYISEGNGLKDMYVIRTDNHDGHDGRTGGHLAITNGSQNLSTNIGPFTIITWVYTNDASDWNTIYFCEGVGSGAAPDQGAQFLRFKRNGSVWSYRHECNVNAWEKDIGPIGKYSFESSGWTMIVYKNIMQKSHIQIIYYNASNPNGVVYNDTEEVKLNLYMGGYDGEQNFTRFGGQNNTYNIGNNSLGFLGPFMLYSRALTETEIKQIFNYYKGNFLIGDTYREQFQQLG